MKVTPKIPVPAIGFNPPVYICKRRTKDFVLDGNIDKDFWKDVPFTYDFPDIEGSIRPVPRFKTRTKLQWDDEYLYIAAVLYGNEIWATLTERDCVIFQDNDFEIFIDPDSDTQGYYEFEMNALNTVWDLLLTKAYRDNGKAVNCYDMHGLRTAVHINGSLNSLSKDNVSWSVEVVIPFKAITECSPFTGTPKANDYFRLNFSRVQWTVDEVNGRIEKRKRPGSELPLPEDNWVWAPTGVINIHYPELWGFLVFSDNDSTAFDIPKEELVKWELRKLYYAEHICFEANGSFTSDLKVLKSILQEYSPCEENKHVKDLDYTIQTTDHSFEISVKTEGMKEGSRISIFADGRTTIF